MTKWTARMYILCSCLVPKVRFGSLAWAMERSLPQDQGLKKSDRRIVRFLAALLARLFPTQYAECEKLAKADANFEAFVKDMKCHRYLAREVKFSVMLGSGSSAVAGMVAYIHGVMQGQKPSKSVLASLTLAGGSAVALKQLLEHLKEFVTNLVLGALDSVHDDVFGAHGLTRQEVYELIFFLSISPYDTFPLQNFIDSWQALRRHELTSDEVKKLTELYEGTREPPRMPCS